MAEEINIENRKQVAKILREVRIGNLSVRKAMLLYPKDIKDNSLLAAYHALIHYEADEDLRRRDELYKEEQDDYIEFIANILDSGDNLPENIINNYKQYYESAPILHEHNFKGFLKSFFKFLNVYNKNKDIH